MLGESSITWDSRKQRMVALSSIESEYMALTEGAKEVIFLKKFFEKLNIEDSKRITIFCDNLGAIKLAENSVCHGRSKHIDIRHYFVRDVIRDGSISVKHIPTEEMVADFLTKGLPKHEKCIDLCGMHRITRTENESNQDSRGVLELWRSPHVRAGRLN